MGPRDNPDNLRTAERIEAAAERISAALEEFRAVVKTCPHTEDVRRLVKVTFDGGDPRLSGSVIENIRDLARDVGEIKKKKTTTQDRVWQVVLMISSSLFASFLTYILMHTK